MTPRFKTVVYYRFTHPSHQSLGRIVAEMCINYIFFFPVVIITFFKTLLTNTLSFPYYLPKLANLYLVPFASRVQLYSIFSSTRGTFTCLRIVLYRLYTVFFFTLGITIPIEYFLFYFYYYLAHYVRGYCNSFICLLFRSPKHFTTIKYLEKTRFE